ESSELDLPEKLAFLIHYDRMFTLLSGPYGQTERLKEQLTVELQAFHIVLNIDAIDLDVDNLPYTLLARYMTQDADKGSRQDSRQSKEQAIVELKSFSDSLSQSCRKAILIVSGGKIINAKMLSELMMLSEKAGISLVLFSEKSLAEKRLLKPFADQIYSIHLGSLSVFDLKRYIRRTRTDDAALSAHQLDSLAKESTQDPARVDDLVERILSEPKRPIGLSLIHLSMAATLFVLLASVFFVNDRFLQAEPVNVPMVLDIPAVIQRDKLKVKEGDTLNAIQDEVTKVELAIESDILDIDKKSIQLVVGGSTTLEGARNLKVIEPNKLQRPEPALPQTALVPAQNYSTNSSSENYTLQLAGSGSEEAIKALIAQHTSNIALEYFKTRRGKQDWYILTAGNFGSRQAALLAVSSLPLALKNMKPWARSIASIQGVSS
ncbi:MAG: septal ring-binding cell division protein DamX, partial [Litorivivens sp.]